MMADCSLVTSRNRRLVKGVETTMARPAFALLQNYITPPAIPKPPNIVGIGEIPSERSLETHSAPYIAGDLLVVRTLYWNRIHFCNVNCGAPCKVSWRYKRGISIAEINEISSKIGAQLQAIGLPGVSAEIGSKISSTTTHSSEEEASREFTRTAPSDGGVTHAHWQLMERYTLIWSVKKWYRKVKIETDIIEGTTDAFDETLLFYTRPDCSASKDHESLLDKIKRGLQPLIAQGAKAGVLLPGKPNVDGSFALEDLPGTYKPEDRIPANLIRQYLNFSPPELDLLSEAFQLQPYRGSLASLLEMDRPRSLSRQDNPWLAFGIGAAVGTILGFLFAARSGRETRDALMRNVHGHEDYLRDTSDLKERVREALEAVKERLATTREQPRRGSQEASQKKNL